MAKKSSYATMTVDALFKMRDEISEVLSSRATELQRQLVRLTGSGPKRGRPAGKTRKMRKGKRSHLNSAARKIPSWSGPDVAVRLAG